MINRFYENFKKYIKENIQQILILFVCFLILMWPVNYYIITGGGTIDIKNRVKIQNEYKSKGSLHLAYVAELHGNVATYLLSYVIPSWEREDINDYKVEEEEDVKSVDFRNQLELQASIDAAIQVAYQKAGKTFEIKKEHLYVTYVAKNSLSKLKVGDEILTVAGKKITNFEELRALIESYEVNDEILFKVRRNQKEKEIVAKIYLEKNRKVIGITMNKSVEYKTKPPIKLQFKKSESGPSGGLMLALDIYNKLTKQDITKGRKIVGTGTISEDGRVGEIGGVKYKLMGAVKKKADIFIVPQGENYQSAIKEAKKKKYNIQIIGVKTWEEALEKLAQ